MNLDKLRLQIDQLDQKILRLLNERLSLAPVIGQKKKQIGGEIFAPDREEALLAQLIRQNKGPCEERDLRALYREIFSSSRARQGGLKLGIPQEDLASYGMARAVFGNQEQYIGMQSLSKGLHALRKKEIDLYCFPVSYWLSADDFVKNSKVIMREVRIAFQLQPPLLTFGQKRSPLPPYWVLERKTKKNESHGSRSGWFFFEGKPNKETRIRLQRFFEEKGWEPKIDCVIEYSNRQTWRCGVEWRDVLTRVEYQKGIRELRKFKEFHLDIAVGAERNIG